MKKIFLLLLGVLLLNGVKAQVKTVTFDYNTNTLNGGTPLPPEERFMLVGNIETDISLVSMDVFRNNKRLDTLFSMEWRRPKGSNTTEFVLPVQYLLRENSRYDFVFHFYRTIEDSARIDLYQAVSRNLGAYIDQAIVVKNNGVGLQSTVNSTMEEMKWLVDGSFLYYKNLLPQEFPGFSDIVRNRLKQLKNKRIQKSAFKERENKTDRQRLFNEYVARLKENVLTLAMSEVTPYLSGKMAVVTDVKEVQQFPTEKWSRALSLNVGYGGVYLSGNMKHLEYASAPYVGVSFPLGNKSFSPFWGNTSFSLGVFLKDLKDEEGNRISGPIVGLPYFAGFGYKFLNIFRIQAGAVATSTEKTTFNDLEKVRIEDFKIKPFVGLSAEINLWLGFNKRK